MGRRKRRVGVRKGRRGKSGEEWRKWRIREQKKVNGIGKEKMKRRGGKQERSKKREGE